MGKPWKFNELKSRDWIFQIIDGTGRGLYLAPRQGKFVISGIYKKGKASFRPYSSPTINCSISRPAKDIAADIERRFFPDYEVSYQEALERFQEKKTQDQKLDLIAQAFIKVTGGSLLQHHRSCRAVHTDNAVIEIWSEDSITVEIRNMNVDEAITLAAVYAGNKKT